MSYATVVGNVEKFLDYRPGFVQVDKIYDPDATASPLCIEMTNYFVRTAYLLLCAGQKRLLCLLPLTEIEKNILESEPDGQVLLRFISAIDNLASFGE